MVHHGRLDRVTATARKLEDVADLAERFGDAVLPLTLDEQIRGLFDANYLGMVRVLRAALTRV